MNMRATSSLLIAFILFIGLSPPWPTLAPHGDLLVEGKLGGFATAVICEVNLPNAFVWARLLMMAMVTGRWNVGQEKPPGGPRDKLDRDSSHYHVCRLEFCEVVWGLDRCILCLGQGMRADIDIELLCCAG